MKTNGPRRGRRPRRAASGPPAISGATGAKSSPVAGGQTPAYPTASSATDAASAAPPPSPLTLPFSYGKSRLVLMDIDPFKVYAYWEVTPQDQRAATRRLGRAAASATWVLRFHDVTSAGSDESSAHTWFDVTVALTPGNWYVDMWAAAKSYWVELGPRGASGRFIPVCRSNLLRTPPADVSARYEPRMLRVEGDFDTVAPADDPTEIEAVQESSSSLVPSIAEPPAEAEPSMGAERLAEAVEAAHGDVHFEAEEPAEPDAAATRGPEPAPPLALNDREIWRRFAALSGTPRRCGDAEMSWTEPATTPTPAMRSVDEPERRRHPDDPFTNPVRPGQDGAPVRSADDDSIPAVTLMADASGTVSSSTPSRASKSARTPAVNCDLGSSPAGTGD